MLDANSPLSVVMEAKHPKQNLNYHVPRLRHYLTSLNVRYGLLTNGKEIRIYERLKKDVQLIYQCMGEDVEAKIEELKGLIGRESLRNKQVVDKVQIQVSEDNSSVENKKVHSMKTIAIYHNKGGVGKTTVAVNLAAALSNQGKRVLLIDIDSQANSTFATGLIKFQFDEDDDLREQNISHILESADFNSISETRRQSHYFNNPEIDVVPSHINLIDKQDKLNKIAVSRSRLISKLQSVKTDYDIVIIDTPPSRDYYAEVALIASDYLIIPSDLKPFANQGLPTVKNFINQINEYRGLMTKPPVNIIGVLASKISTNAKFLQYTFPKQRNVISERYGFPLLETVIYDRSSLSECMNNTLVVGELEYPDPKSIIKYAEIKTSAQTSAMEFEMLAKEVLQKIGVNE